MAALVAATKVHANAEPLLAVAVSSRPPGPPERTTAQMKRPNMANGMVIALNAIKGLI
jgi:hypothetical protein